MNASSTPVATLTQEPPPIAAELETNSQNETRTEARPNEGNTTQATPEPIDTRHAIPTVALRQIRPSTIHRGPMRHWFQPEETRRSTIMVSDQIRPSDFDTWVPRMFLRFLADAELTYTPVPDPNRMVDREEGRLDVEAGQVVLISDPALGMVNYQPAIWSANAIAYVNGIVPVVQQSLLMFPEMAKITFRRSSEELSFWAAIAANADDQLPRLIYADWLDEHNDPLAAIMRDPLPFVLHYEIYDEGNWVYCHRRPVDWGTAIDEIHKLSDQRIFVPPTVGAEWFVNLSLVGQLTQRVTHHNTIETVRTDRRLSVSGENHRPLPPIVNYLLLYAFDSLVSGATNRLDVNEIHA